MAIAVADVTESTADLVHTWNYNLPATVNANELLLTLHAVWNDQTGGVITPSGHTLIFTDNDGENCRFHVFAKTASGSEDGGTVTITYNDADSTMFGTTQVYRISGWKNSGVLTDDIKVDSFFDGASCNPPNLTPGWGAEGNLWIAMGTEDIDTLTSSDVPANYTNGVKTRAAGRSQILSGRRILSAASENPGAMGSGLSGRIFGVTIAVRPSSTDRFVKVSWVALEATDEEPPPDEGGATTYGQSFYNRHMNRR